MAKESMKAREVKRAKLVARYEIELVDWSSDVCSSDLKYIKYYTYSWKNHKHQEPQEGLWWVPIIQKYLHWNYYPN